MALKSILFASALCLIGQGAIAQSDEVLAAVRAELSMLQAELQDIRTELTKPPVAGAPLGAEAPNPAALLERLDALEAELRSLTGQVERQGFVINQRLTAAESRLVSAAEALGQKDGLGPIESLQQERDPFPQRPSNQTTLTVREQADFERIIALIEAGDFIQAARRSETFVTTYPGGPMTFDVMLRLAQAYAAQERWDNAAQAYLNLFTEAGDDDVGSRALMGLAESFEALEKAEDACRSYLQVGQLYPSSASVIPADLALKRLQCAE